VTPPAIDPGRSRDPATAAAARKLMTDGAATVGAEMALVSGVATLQAGLIEKYGTLYGSIRDLVGGAWPLIAGAAAGDLLAAAQAPVPLATTNTDDVRAALVPLARRLGGAPAATEMDKLVTALEAAVADVT
jgi:hypothetical protein